MSTKDPASPSGPGPADPNPPAGGGADAGTLPSGRKKISGKFSADDLKPLNTPRPRLTGKLSAADIAGPPEVPRPPRASKAAGGFEEAAVASRLRKDAQALQSGFVPADLAAVEALRQERQHRQMPADSAFHRGQAVRPPNPNSSPASPPASTAAARPPQPQAVEDVAFRDSAPAPLGQAINGKAPPVAIRSTAGAGTVNDTPQAAPVHTLPPADSRTAPPLPAQAGAAPLPAEAKAGVDAVAAGSVLPRAVVEAAPPAAPNRAAARSPDTEPPADGPFRPPSPPSPPSAPLPEAEPANRARTSSRPHGRWSAADLPAEDAVLRAPAPAPDPTAHRPSDPVDHGQATARTPAWPGAPAGMAEMVGSSTAPSPRLGAQPVRRAAVPVSPLPPGVALQLLLVLGLATGGAFLATLGWSTFGAWGMLPFSGAALMVLVHLGNRLDSSGRWRATFVVMLAALLAFGGSVYLVQRGMGYWDIGEPAPQLHEADWRVMTLLLLSTAAAWVGFSRYKRPLFTWPVMLGFWLVLLESSGYSGAVDPISSRNLGLITVAFGIAVAGGAGWIYRRYGAGQVARDLAYHPYLCGSTLALIGTWYAWPHSWLQYAAALGLLAAFAAGWFYAQKPRHALAWMGFSIAMVLCAMLGKAPSLLVRDLRGLLGL